MGSYILRRLLQSVVVIIGVTLVTFLALQAGGDPTYLFVSERASQEEIETTRRALGFDRPLHVQYASFVGDLARGDFGQSLSYRQPAMDIVLEALPATIELTIFSLVIALLLAIPLGVLAAINRGTAWDGSITTFAMLGQSIPNFWLGIMMILFYRCSKSNNLPKLQGRFFQVTRGPPFRFMPWWWLYWLNLKKR